MDDDWLSNVGSNFTNPDPVVMKESDSLVNDFLSPARLQKISGQNDLSKVDAIEMNVNTSETTLGNFGQYLPNLTQLKLNDSCIPSIRDIGTSFSNLIVLWMSRCRVNEIDGIASMQSLQELYIAYNNIADLSPISFLENIEVIDLEGNKVSDVDQIDYLAILPNLNTLTLTGNPVCLNYRSKSKKSFRQYVLKRLPHLHQYDDISAKILKPAHVPIAHCQEDIDIITNAIKDGIDIENNLRSISPDSSVPAQDIGEASNPSSSLLPSTFCMSPLKTLTTTRPATAVASARRKQTIFDETSSLKTSGISPRPGSSGSDNGMLASDDLSTLTIGDPLCGNPLQALKQRKKGPMPTFSFLSNDIENLGLNLQENARPMTSLGFRCPPSKFSRTRCIISDNGNESKITSESSDIPCSSKDDDSTLYIPGFMKTLNSKSNGLCQFKSPSPPLYKVCICKVDKRYALCCYETKSCQRNFAHLCNIAQSNTATYNCRS